MPRGCSPFAIRCAFRAGVPIDLGASGSVAGNVRALSVLRHRSVDARRTLGELGSIPVAVVFRRGVTIPQTLARGARCR